MNDVDREESIRLENSLHHGLWLNHYCPDCGSPMLIDDSCNVWCSEGYDFSTNECKMKGHIKVDC